jgi:VWFA-related protein
VVVLLFLAGISDAQPQDERPVFRSTTAAVTVDVVVRDRHGRPVVGLTKDDFEIMEDGIAQDVISVESRSTGAATSGDAGRAHPSVQGDGLQSLVAMVFDQMTTQSRKGAVDAASSMIDSIPHDEYVGVFTMDLRWTVHAGFTRDRAALLRALTDVLKTPSVSPLSTLTVGVAESNDPPGRPATADARLASETRQRLDNPTELENYSGAQAASLTDIITRLARFPGRKSILLFSEGLAASPRLEAVVARALAENVTVYAVNTSGLTTSNRVVPPARDVDKRELTSSSRRGRESWRYGFLELDSTGGLGPLAAHTGGFLVANTNDLSAALNSINLDRRSYYVLGYSSSNPSLDSTKRQIDVRVKRPDLSVRARTSYLASMPEAERESVENRALAALTRTPRPRDFEFSVRAYRTPKPNRLHLISVVLEVPADALVYNEQTSQKKYAGELTVFIRLVTTSTVVAAQSQVYELTGDLARLPAFKRRPLAYLRTMTVTPGTYRLEVVLEDTVSGRTSTSELAITSDVGGTVAVGDLVMVGEVSRASPKRATEHPFGWGRTIITPNLRDRVERVSRDRVPFAVSLVGSGRLDGQLTLEGPLGRVAQIPVTFQVPPKDGGMIGLVDLPIGRLAPGNYKVGLTINDGHRHIERQTHFTLQQ